MICKDAGVVWRAALLGTASMMVLGGRAEAQDPAPPQGAATSTDTTTPPVAASLPTSIGARTTESGDVDEIVVTAQKRSERLQDVPITINAVSGAALEKSGVTRLNQLQQVVAGVVLTASGDAYQPSIRGVSTTVQGPGGENNVAIYVDGIYQPYPRGLNLDLANVAQVSVLKGPQGTLFGRNATGGAIVIDTLQPSLTKTSGRIGASYGNFDDRRAQGYFSTPLTQDLAFNVAGSYRKSDGYVKDDAGFNTAPVNNYSVDAKLLFEPSSRLSFTLKGSIGRVSDGIGGADTNESHSLSLLVAPGIPIEMRNNRTSLTHPSVDRANKKEISLKTEYKMSFATLTSRTDYLTQHDFLRTETDGTPLILYDVTNRDHNRAFQQELNLTSTSTDPISYVLGAYYFNSRQKEIDGFTSTQYFPAFGGLFPTASTSGSPDILTKTKAYAGYADATWHAADRLFLTAGIRYSHERRSLAYLVAGTSTTLLGADPATFHSFTPRGVVRFQITPDTNVYASVSKGFKSGQLNVVPNAQLGFSPYKPEKLTAYEIGFKTADGPLRFDTSAYYYDYKNLQVTNYELFFGQLLPVIVNAATARIYGAEAQVSDRIGTQLNLRGSVAYTHARYRKFPNAEVYKPDAFGVNSTTCPTAADANAICMDDEHGQQLVRSPDWTANVGGDYTIPIGEGSVVLASNVAYTSAYQPTLSDLGLDGTGYRYRQKGFALVSAQVTYRLPGNRLSITAYGDNITNKHYDLDKTGNTFGDYHVEGEPRSYGVRADFSF